jgi:hypothetical protein
MASIPLLCKEVCVKIVSLLLALACALALAACGQAQPTTAPATPPTSAPQPTVAPAGAPENNQPSSSGDPQSHGGAVKDHVSLVDFLRSQGVMVTIGDPVEQPFLRGAGTTLLLSGGPLQAEATVQSYDYDDTDLGGDAAAMAAEDVAGIQPDGKPKLTQVAWIEPPHWFAHERVIALYLGSDPAALDLLTSALGPQFAGK